MEEDLAHGTNLDPMLSQDAHAEHRTARDRHVRISDGEDPKFQQQLRNNSVSSANVTRSDST